MNQTSGFEFAEGLPWYGIATKQWQAQKSGISSISRLEKTLHNISYHEGSGEHIQASPELIDTGSSMAATDPAADIKSQLALCSATCLGHFGHPRGEHFEFDTNSIQFPLFRHAKSHSCDVWWLAWNIAALMRQGLRPSWLAARRGESQIICNCRAASACLKNVTHCGQKG